MIRLWRCAGCSPTTTSRASANCRHIREAVGIARSLLQAGVLDRLPEADPTADGTG